MKKRCFIVLVSCLLAAGPVRGQEMFELVLEQVLQELAEEGNELGAEQLVEHFRILHGRPVDINRATVEELEQLYLLTDFQIVSLMEYRERSGPVLSLTELQLINGFDEGTARLLAPFIEFGTATGRSAGNGGKGRWNIDTELLAKWSLAEGKEEYIGPPFHSQLKFRSSAGEKSMGAAGDKLRVGFTLEKDAGEPVSGKGRLPLGDFFSWHLQAKDISIGKKLEVSNVVVGDYSARFGQGLAVWNAFSMGSGTTLQSVYKRGAKVAPYSSSDENRFFRGGAVTLRRGAGIASWFEATAFFSLKKVDARLSGNRYTSLPSDGLHNTESLMETRKRLGETVYGANLSYRGRRFTAGVNWAGYGYNAWNGRRVQEYNRYQMFNGQYGNFSADMTAILGKARAFAELAMDYGGAYALLAGALFKAGRWDWAVTGRSYSKRYIAPYAGAYSTGSSCSNQDGVSALAQRSAGKVRLALGGDYTHYPWKRYGVPETSSSAVKIWGKVENLQGRSTWNMKVYGNWGSYGDTYKYGVKWLYGRNPASWLAFKGRGEFLCAGAGVTGFAAGADMDMKVWNGFLRVVMRGAYYCCREWAGRIYMYEHDLPSSFSSSLLYGEGFNWYALLVCKLGRFCSIYLKGEGEPRIKVGLKMRFF